MRRLCRADLLAALAVVGLIGATPTLEEFPFRVLSSVGDLLGADAASYTEVDEHRHRHTVVRSGGPAGDPLMGVLSYRAHTGDGRAVMVMRFMRTRRDFTERERDLLDLLRPHISLARENVKARQESQTRIELLERVLESDGAPDPDRVRELGLTAREGEIVALAARGLSDAQIADRLVLSVRTVEKHLEHAYRKLNVTERRQAVARVLGEVLPAIRSQRV